MQVEHNLEGVVLAEGVVEVHGPAARHHEDVMDILSGDEVRDIVREFHGTTSARRKDLMIESAVESGGLAIEHQVIVVVAVAAQEHAVAQAERRHVERDLP